MNTKLILIGLVGFAAFEFPASVSGQYGEGGYPYVAIGWAYACPRTYCGDSVPYFALHPPVYYSYRVARTYSYSPFPYPPGVLTPGSEPPRPLLVQNPYAMPSGDLLESQRGRQPLRIDNPFVDQPNGSGVAKGPKSAVRRPQVVYPAAMAHRTGENPPNCGKSL